MLYSTSSETSTTFLSQSAFTETLVLNPTGLTYGSGSYEIYSSSQWCAGSRNGFSLTSGLMNQVRIGELRMHLKDWNLSGECKH